LKDLTKISFSSLTKPSNSKHTCPYALGLFVVNLSSDKVCLLLEGFVKEEKLIFVKNDEKRDRVYKLKEEDYYTLYILFVKIFFFQFIYSISFLIIFDKNKLFFFDERFTTNKPKAYGQVCLLLEGFVKEEKLIFVKNDEKNLLLSIYILYLFSHHF
jgi:hypothetical protein